MCSLTVKKTLVLDNVSDLDNGLCIFFYFILGNKTKFDFSNEANRKLMKKNKNKYKRIKL
jgi:hypothetical protein